jgi:hypothetical protein
MLVSSIICKKIGDTLAIARLQSLEFRLGKENKILIAS